MVFSPMKKNKASIFRTGFLLLTAIIVLGMCPLRAQSFSSHSLIGKYLKGTGGSSSQRASMGGKPQRQAESDSIGRILSKADELVRNGSFKDSEELLKKAIMRYPLAVKLKLALGLVYERTEDSDKAMEAYRSIIGVDADNVPALSSLAYLMIENNMSASQASKLIKRALDLNPDCGRAYDALGWAAFRRKRNSEAIKYFAKAREASPYDPSPVYHEGLVALRERKTARALSAFQQVIELDPAHDKAYISLGILYMQMGETKKAVLSLNRALAIAGNDSVVSKSIVELVRKASPHWQPSDVKKMQFSFSRMGFRRDFFEALDFSDNEPPEDTISKIPQAGSAQAGLRKNRNEVSDGNLHTKASERISLLPEISEGKNVKEEPAPVITMEEAVAASEGLVQQNMVSRHMRLGRLYYEYGLMHEAASEFQTVINISPLSSEARESRELVVPLSDFEELSIDEKLEGFLKVGEALFTRSDKEGAILQYQKILLMEPGNALAHKNLAYIYLKDGLEAQAWEHVEEALKTAPELGEALVLKGFILARRRNFAKAHEAFSEACKVLPGNSESGRYAAGMLSKMSLFTELR